MLTNNTLIENLKSEEDNLNDLTDKKGHIIRK